MISHNNISFNQPKRVFGRDITNLEKVQRKTKNASYSLLEKNVEKKDISSQGYLYRHQQHPSLKIKAKSLYGKKETKKDPITDYQIDILKYISSIQNKQAQETQQNNVTQKMRMILIDWLIDVHESFELKEQTLYLALAYLNKFASSSNIVITKQEYQLAGIACLWIASKYQQIYPPKTENYIQVTASTYTKAQLIKMEGRIIETLSFNLNIITPLNLIQCTSVSSICQTSVSDKIYDKWYNLQKYILQASLLQGLGKKFTPIQMALAAIALSDSICQIKTDTTKLRLSYNKQNFGKEQIMECFKEMCKILKCGNRFGLSALKRKYQKKKYGYVSKIKLESKRSVNNKTTNDC